MLNVFASKKQQNDVEFLKSINVFLVIALFLLRVAEYTVVQSMKLHFISNDQTELTKKRKVFIDIKSNNLKKFFGLFATFLFSRQSPAFLFND